MQEILRAEYIDKMFHDPISFHVLKNISLSINKGGFVSIMGKSGCGKSTLMYVLATLDTGYSGTLTINNKKVTGLKQNELAQFRNNHIGFVFQSHFLLPEFTVLQNVMIPALKRNKKSAKKIETDAKNILKQMEMEAFCNHPGAKLSGGQQQKVAVARALINDPEIIMADEPTGNLDSVSSLIIQNIFRELANAGNTIITITHDEDFGAKSDKQFVIKDGVLSSENISLRKK